MSLDSLRHSAVFTHSIKWCLHRVISKGDFRRGFQMGDFKTRLISSLCSKMKLPNDRNFSICGGFHFEAKLST